MTPNASSMNANNVGKSPDESAIETVTMMMPSHSNPSWDNGQVELGNVNGGAILNLIDNVAGQCALRHCRSRVVTASIDRMSFHNPVHVGELLILKARVNYVGNTSLEVGVRVETENLSTGERLRTGTAFLTMVCVDAKGKPKPAPKLLLKSEDDKRRNKEALERLKARKAEREKKKSQ